MLPKTVRRKKKIVGVRFHEEKSVLAHIGKTELPSWISQPLDLKWATHINSFSLYPIFFFSPPFPSTQPDSKPPSAPRGWPLPTVQLSPLVQAVAPLAPIVVALDAPFPTPSNRRPPPLDQWCLHCCSLMPLCLPPPTGWPAVADTRK
jgi:hypothetical protein